MTTTTTTMTTTKTLTALALAAAALTVTVGPSEAAPRLQNPVTTAVFQQPSTPLAGIHTSPVFRVPTIGVLTGLHTVPFHELPPGFISPPASPPKISCFACNLPHGGPQGGARPPGYSEHPPYHGPGYGWGYGDHWPHGWGYGYGNYWPYHGWYNGDGNRWGYGYYRWYRWHPVYYGGAPYAAAPVAEAPAPVATYAAPQAPIGGCDCLTKKMLPNGAELLQDICTKQSAIAQPQALSAR